MLNCNPKILRRQAMRLGRRPKLMAAVLFIVLLFVLRWHLNTTRPEYHLSESDNQTHEVHHTPPYLAPITNVASKLWETVRKGSSDIRALLPFNHRKNSNFSNLPNEGAATQIQVMLPSKLLVSSDHRAIKGIQRSQAHRYQPDADGFFRCLNSTQRIPMWQVNDEYCDCVDATDEPGTSACQFGSFHCATQSDQYSQAVPSSKVGDRRCDCCDGSDEDAEMKCVNNCAEMMEKAQKRKEQLNAAKVRKLEYEQMAASAKIKMEAYGPKGIFYKLSKACYPHKQWGFQFEVCPYRRVSMYRENGTANLGTKPSLEKLDDENHTWVLKMLEGDVVKLVAPTQPCTKTRHSQIRFQCGLEDRVAAVQEPQRCVYEFAFETPAAC